MKFPRAYSLQEIANLLDCKFIGDEKSPIFGMNEIHVVEHGDIVFADHPKYYGRAVNSLASVVLIDNVIDCPEGKSLLISDNPFRDFNRLMKHFTSYKITNNTRSESVVVGKKSFVYPNCYIGNFVTIGKNCLIYPNVCIYDNTVIGDNVVVHAGTVLGADAFYYKKSNDGLDQLTSAGRVVVRDNVHIGALCTIDKGITGDTTIGKGTKIDNQVHIGHDTIIGERCMIASQTGISGCVKIENNVTIWGQVGIISGVTIGENATILAQSGVSKSLKGGKTYLGSPVEESRSKLKQLAIIRRMNLS